MISRRSAVASFLAFAARSPLFAQNESELLALVNVDEFEEIAKKKMHRIAYDFIAGGAENEWTLRANREAFDHVAIIPRVMVDVTNIDMSVELFGQKLDSPLLIAPTGGKNFVMPNADEVVAEAALKMNTPMCTAAGADNAGKRGLTWWVNTTGQPRKEFGVRFSKGSKARGAKAIVVTVDNPYQSNRDRNSRNRLDYAWMRTGIPKEGEPYKPQRVQTPAMWSPHVPGMTWEYISWLREGSDLPVILKGILSSEDAKLAVEHKADAIVVSNHGGRQLDGAIATLDALPDVVDAVGGKIPVLMDGGIRRGVDIVKALALGASAVLIGRAPLWGLGAFGQPGVERVLWLLNAELKLAMALAGVRSVKEMNRKLVKKV